MRDPPVRATPAFTVVVATFERGPHIVPTIEAALDQTFRDFELLVVGDGVTDDTLDQVPRGDPRVGIIALPWNSGSQATPNNVGIAAARGRYVAYLGSDDIWMPNHLAALAQAFEATGCDVAVSGCAYQGPPGTNLVWVTGLTENLDARRDFLPPTSLAHRSSLAPEIGGWRAPDTIPAPVDVDFLTRAAESGARFVSSGRITAQKFAAGHRYLSYLEPSSTEQRDMLAAIRSGHIDDRTCADYAERARAAGTFGIANPDVSGLAPGHLFHWNRSNKGADIAAPVELTEAVHVPQSMEPRALDWYAPEQSPEGTTFRWSGPSLRPKLLVPFTGQSEVKITLHLTDIDPARIIDGIRLALNGEPVAHQVRREHPGRVDLAFAGRLRSRKASVVELMLPRAFCPAATGGSSDRRRLGVILDGFTVTPENRTGNAAVTHSQGDTSTNLAKSPL
jgi:glycosyltransferase involved in cell wall biosynthesis